MFEHARSLLRRMTGTGTDDDRRRHPRRDTDVETTCYLVAGGPAIGARIRNVSRAGLGLFLDHPVEPGQMLRIELPGPADAPHTVVLGCMMHCTAVAEGWIAGCMFSYELTDSELKLFGGERTKGKPQDQRAWVRYPATGEVLYRIMPDEAGPFKKAKVANISPAGIGLFLDDKLDPGTVLTVELHRSEGRADLEILACVVYLTPRREGGWAVGCNFIHELGDGEMQDLL